MTEDQIPVMTNGYGQMEEAKDVSCWKALLLSIFAYFVVTYFVDKAIKFTRDRRK